MIVNGLLVLHAYNSYKHCVKCVVIQFRTQGMVSELVSLWFARRYIQPRRSSDTLPKVRIITGQVIILMFAHGKNHFANIVNEL